MEELKDMEIFAGIIIGLTGISGLIFLCFSGGHISYAEYRKRWEREALKRHEAEEKMNG